MSSLIEKPVEDGILTLVLNEPKKKNALTDDLRAALRDALHRAQDDASVRAIVLTGAAGAFSSGGDISAMTSDTEVARRRMQILHDVVWMLLAGRKPTVAAVSGAAFGAGFSLALCCDQVVADDTAKFSASFGRVGLPPDLGLTFTLPRRIGDAAARRILLSSAIVGAEEAAGLGLVDSLVPRGALEEESHRLASEMSAFTQGSKGHVKRLLTASAGDLSALLEQEMASYLELLGSDEHAAAREAFLNRSKSR